MKPLTRITSFVMEQAETQPLLKREQLYRDLGAIAPTALKAQSFTRLADDLRQIDINHRQLALDLRSSALIEGIGGES